MNEEPYSNREINEKWNDIDGKLNAILAQTTKTNGRVSRLEIGFVGVLCLLIGLGVANAKVILSLFL